MRQLKTKASTCVVMRCHSMNVLFSLNDVLAKIWQDRFMQLTLPSLLDSLYEFTLPEPFLNTFSLKQNIE